VPRLHLVGPVWLADSASIPHRFAEVAFGYLLLSLEVGDGAGDADDVTARGR
jgi:hypothetical protein